MDWDKFKNTRQKLIGDMQAVLDDTESIGLSRFVVYVMGTPVLLWQITKLLLIVSFTCAVRMVAALLSVAVMPFFALYFVFDMAMIAVWYLRAIARKISEDKP